MQPNDQQPNPEIPATAPVMPGGEVPQSPNTDISAESAAVPPTPVGFQAGTQESVVTPSMVSPQPMTTTPENPANTAAPQPVFPTMSQQMPPSSTVVMGGAIASPTPTKSGLKKFKLAALIVGVVFLLVGSSAGAYFGVIVPNKPENVLKQAVANTLQQKQINYEGTIDTTTTSKSDTKSPLGGAVDVTFKGGVDSDKNAADTNVTVTVSGIKVQGELRYIDQNLYVKLGDLSTIKNFVSVYSPEAPKLLGKVENQWIVVDKTLLTQSSGCSLDQKITWTNSDLKLLSDSYDKVQFATINSKAGDKVNGKSATKFDLTIDDDKLVDYGKNLGDLSVVKQFKSCSKDSNETTPATTKDHKSTPVTIWVDKSTKRIVKFATKSTDASVSVTLSYGPVTVDTPQNAKPIMQLVSEFTALYSGKNGVQGAKSNDPLSLLGL